MFTQFNAIRSLFEAIPAPVEFLIGARPFPLIPLEFSSQIEKGEYKLNKISAVYFSIRNLSDQSLKDIRIKIPSKSLYEPRIFPDANGEFLEYAYNGDKREIVFKILDPRASIQGFLYPHCDEGEGFNDKLVQCIISDRKVSKTQRELAFLKRNPKFAVSIISIMISCLALALFSGFKILSPFGMNDNSDLLSKAHARIGRACVLEVVQVTMDLRNNLAKSFMPVEFIEFINSARSIEDLEMRDRIVICNDISQGR
jgi:hypothetical protein